MKTTLTHVGQIKELKEDGTGVCVFATLNIKDLDGDVLLPGCLGSQTAKLVGAHDWKAPNIGSAKISEQGNQAIAEFKFYLEMESAKEWYASMKANFDNGIPQEYSFGFNVDEASSGEWNGEQVRFLKKLTCFEISFVMLGAGINTRTLAIKSAESAEAKELQGSWEVTQEAIRDAAYALLVGNRDGYVSIQGTYDTSVVVCVYFWDDASGINSDDTYYRFDWTMNADGSIALANQQAVDLQLIVVEKNLKLAEQEQRVHAESRSYLARLKALAALRAKEGRTLSRANWERLDRLNAQLVTMQSDISDLLASTTVQTEDVAKSATPDELFAAWLRVKSQLAGHIV